MTAPITKSGIPEPSHSTSTGCNDAQVHDHIVAGKDDAGLHVRVAGFGALQQVQAHAVGDQGARRDDDQGSKVGQLFDLERPAQHRDKVQHRQGELKIAAPSEQLT